MLEEGEGRVFKNIFKKKIMLCQTNISVVHTCCSYNIFWTNMEREKVGSRRHVRSLARP